MRAGGRGTQVTQDCCRAYLCMHGALAEILPLASPEWCPAFQQQHFASKILMAA